MNTAIAAILQKEPSWKWLELIEHSLLSWRFSRDEGEGRELARLVEAGTVLYLNSDWIDKLSLEVHPVDSTDKFHIFRNIEVVNFAVEEIQGLGRSIRDQGISRSF